MNQDVRPGWYRFARGTRRKHYNRYCPGCNQTFKPGEWYMQGWLSVYILTHVRCVPKSKGGTAPD